MELAISAIENNNVIMMGSDRVIEKGQTIGFVSISWNELVINTDGRTFIIDLVDLIHSIVPKS